MIQNANNWREQTAATKRDTEHAKIKFAAEMSTDPTQADQPNVRPDRTRLSQAKILTPDQLMMASKVEISKYSVNILHAVKLIL